MCAQSLQSCPTLCDPKGCSTPGSSVSGDSAGKNTGVGCHALLQGFFPTQGSNPGLLHCRQILYQLSHQGSPRIMECVVYSFSRGSSQEKNQGLLHCRQILYQLSHQGSPTYTYKYIYTYTYIYTHSFFLSCFSIVVYHRILNIVLCAIQ